MKPREHNKESETVSRGNVMSNRENSRRNVWKRDIHAGIACNIALWISHKSFPVEFK